MLTNHSLSHGVQLALLEAQLLQGEIDRSTFLIDKTGTVARVWRKVKVPGHAAEVMEAAKALG